MVPEVYQQWGPFFAEYNSKFVDWATFNMDQQKSRPYIFNPKSPDTELNFFITEFFDLYPEMKISLFYFGGAEAIQMENRGVYKLLVHFFKHFERLKRGGLDAEGALEKTFAKFDDYVRVKMQEVSTTQVIAQSLRVRPLLSFLQADSFKLASNKLAKTQRDVEFLEMGDRLGGLEEVDSSVE